MRQIPKARPASTVLAGTAKAPVSPAMSADIKLQAALDRISILERQMSLLLGAIEIGTSGDVRLSAPGTLTLDGARGVHVRSDVEVVASGPASSLVVAMGEVAVESAARVRVQGATVQCSAGMVQIDAGMCRASGTVKCDTIIANSVVGSSYTPGAGNVW